MPLHTVNGFVAAQVQVAGILAKAPALPCWQCGVSIGLVAGSKVGCAIAVCLLLRFLAPAAGHDKVHRASAREVQRNDGVLSQTAALHEKNLELLRHGQQFAQVCLRLFVDRDELLAPMAHFHHAHAAAMPVEHFSRRLRQYLQRHRRRSGRKVIRALHLHPLRHRSAGWRRSRRCAASRSVWSLRPGQSG